MIMSSDARQQFKSKRAVAGSLRRLWLHLAPRRKRQFVMLLLLVLVSAMAEMVSLGAVVPFLGALIAPEQLFKHASIASAARSLGIASPDALILPLTVTFILAAMGAAAVRMLLLWTTTRLSYATGADLSFDMYRRTLFLPYQAHLQRNSSEVISTITRKVDGAVIVLYMTLALVSSAILLVSVLAVLLAVNVAVALAAVGGFGGCYFLISRYFRARLARNARAVSEQQTQVIKALQEGLGGIRDVLLDGTQPYYCDIYRRADVPLRNAMGDNIFIAGSPRFAMEALGMVFIAILAYTLHRADGGAAAALPILGVLALGAQRLLPVLQQGFNSWVNIAGYHASLVDVLEFLDQPLPKEAFEPAPPMLAFEDAIEFDRVRFRYAAEGPWVLDNLSLTIRKGTKVGFVGGTGSGKSTTLDLLMGLLDPVEGRILVDRMPLAGTSKRSWQQVIAHVPQAIYLADATIAENIAFGVERSDIDMDRVRMAAKQACIAEFIENNPEGYNAKVGERGVRLSGGQRQRVGIARALYKRATVLVFDEATSALDNTTEQEVMSAIASLDRNLTVLIIAHRLSTVRPCDLIVELGGGKIIAQGSYEHLLKNSSSFRALNNAAT